MTDSGSEADGRLVGGFLDETTNDTRIKLMLRNLNACMERLRRVTGQYRDLDLSEDFTRIHSFVHIMYGAPGRGHAGFESLTPRLESTELGQERGMNVDHSAGECLEERGFDDPHVASQDDEVHVGGFELVHQIRLDFRT